MAAVCQEDSCGVALPLIGGRRRREDGALLFKLTSLGMTFRMGGGKEYIPLGITKVVQRRVVERD